MAVYRIFLRGASLRDDSERSDAGAEATCDSDQDARDLAQRLLEDYGGKGGHAEVWAGSRFVGVVSPMSTEDIARLGQSPEQWSE